MPQDDSMPCAVEGCDRKAHGGSALCSGHAKRRRLGKSLSEPLRPYEHNAGRRVMHALEQFYEDLERRRRQLDELLAGGSELRELLSAIREQAEVAAEDEVAWERAQARVRQALSRYRRSGRSRRDLSHES